MPGMFTSSSTLAHQPRLTHGPRSLPLSPSWTGDESETEEEESQVHPCSAFLLLLPPSPVASHSAGACDTSFLMGKEGVTGGAKTRAEDDGLF